jgi:LysR family transcriptional regulator, glycine cleavage system transcriptional activator
MLEIDIASGRLMTPLPDIRVPRTGYVAIIPRGADEGNVFAGFVDWLVGEARVAGATSAGT